MNQLLIRPQVALTLLFLTAVVAWLPSCASRETAATAVRPGDGIREYQDIVAQALGGMGMALRSLDRVNAQTNRCPPKVLAAFSKDLERLEVESLNLRARSQAMQTRGDAYFENWHENLSQIQDPRIRDLAAKNRAQLQQHFGNIKLSSDRTREIFKPFLAGLRRLQTALENNPGAVQSEATRELIRTTSKSGRQVEQGIASIAQELKAMAMLLTPVKR